VTGGRATLLVLASLAALVCFGCGGAPGAGAAGAGRAESCGALKPAVHAGQQIPSILAGMSTRTLSKTKSELKAAVNVILTTSPSVKTQMRSAPLRVRNAYSWDISAVQRFKVEVEKATTQREISSAAQRLVGRPSRVAPFITYVLTRCEAT
jgi:hypothetical protein